MQNEEKTCFPYHYGGEAESYSFYRVPKVLFTEQAFRRLSTDARMLYGLLLDRMQLSLKNGWIDGDGKVFIYFTVESVMRALGCGNKKAGSLLAELDDKRGVGLITRVKQGLGKPDRIYVRKCVLPRLPDGHVQTCQNDMSGDVEMTGQEISERHANKTDKNKTEFSETDLIHPAPQGGCSRDAMEERNAYRDYFLRQCSFGELKKSRPLDRGMLDEILELLVDVCSSSRESVRISGDDKPIQVVKSRFMKLDSEHIQYVLDCFKGNTTKVHNIKQYLLASLYNAPMTIDSYYTALVRHDMYGAD